MTDDRLYSQTEAAERLRMSADTLRDLVNKNEISYVLVGKRRRFTPSDIAAYIAKCRARAEAQKDSQQRDTRKKSAKRKSGEVFDFKAARKLRKAS